MKFLRAVCGLACGALVLSAGAQDAAKKEAPKPAAKPAAKPEPKYVVQPTMKDVHYGPATN